MIHQRD